MASIYTTIEEYIKYKYGEKDNRITKFLLRVMEELPNNLKDNVKVEDFYLEQDLTYKGEIYIKRYLVKSKNISLSQLLDIYSIYVNE